MTWTRRIRGDSTALVVREYCCGEHGRFDNLEARDVELTEVACPICGMPAPYVVSAPRGTGATVYGYAASTGSGKERPPNALDTRALADGMPMHEWKALRKKQRQEALRKRVRAAVS